MSGHPNRRTGWKRWVHRWRRGCQAVCSRFRLRKVFVIGRNKTGTTSIAHALRELGFNVAPQPPAERLLRDWSQRDFRRLVRFCRWFDAFQDIPFSLPFTFQVLDQAFPGSKFVLSIRRTAEEWYDSMVRFQGKRFGAGHLPTWSDLEEAPNTYPGFLADVHRLVYGVRDGELYQRELYMGHYNAYNASVLDYFRHRPHDLLVVNIGEPEAYSTFCRFLGRQPSQSSFPWKNQT